jgi:hypothetical protein
MEKSDDKQAHFLTKIAILFVTLLGCSTHTYFEQMVSLLFYKYHGRMNYKDTKH